MIDSTHRSGFVNIVGQPNVGKSTLMNALMGDRLSIITSKPQTTRHRILGLLSDDDFQIVFSDSPGIIEDPKYGMQKSMNKFAYSSFSDADVLLFVIDLFEKYTGEEKVLRLLKEADAPVILVINKIDLDKDDRLAQLKEKWSQYDFYDEVIEISAQEKIGTEELLASIREKLPLGPAYYPKDQISDKSVRFFVSEIIREKILEQYKQEIPYSCEIVVEEYKESEKNGKPFAHIFASIYVDRRTQKSIIIGKGGAAIKKLGMAARESIEEFVDHPVYLETKVRIKENWRNDERTLKHFGYQ